MKIQLQKYYKKVSIFILISVVKKFNRDSEEYKKFVCFFISFLFLKAKEKRLFEKNLFL